MLNATVVGQTWWADRLINSGLEPGFCKEDHGRTCTWRTCKLGLPKLSRHLECPYEVLGDITTLKLIRRRRVEALEVTRILVLAGARHVLAAGLSTPASTVPLVLPRFPI